MLIFAALLLLHPRVYVTPGDIEHARRNIAAYPWARQIAAAVRQEADRWLKRDDDWLRKAVPPPGAAYAYGLSGCPICGAGWGPFGRDGGSFDRPGLITCKRGHTLPDAAHPDTGAGYRGPDGRMHYLVGAYNAFAVESLTFGALENLVHAYSLTGDERYAAKAAVVLDAIAAIYPESHKGCWDYPSNPLSGRLDRPWYQASRVLVHYVDQYDQLYNSKALDLPSVRPGLTRRRNIEQNLLRDGGEYCYRQSKTGRLHNGEADYERGALAVGLCLDIPEYVKWALDGPYGIRVLLENNIGRDGTYFETTPMYADHTRELYFTFVDPLKNAGIDLYGNPKLRQFFTFYNLPFHIAGHLPRYGDAPPDLDQRPIPERPFDRSDYDFLEKLYARAGAAGDLLGWIANGAFDRLRGLAPYGGEIPDRRVQAGMSIYRDPGDTTGGGFTDRLWMLFHAGAPPAAAALGPRTQRRLLGSDFLGQKGVAVLRNGMQGLLLRYGPSLVHGHYDDLNVNYVARGYELTYDLGYGHSAATRTQAGWARQTASHNVVVVDEHSQLEAGPTGGSLHLFADTPLLKLAEASSETSYAARNVSVYRRTVALIGSGEDAYWLDIFRVRGGRRHDWIFHALGGRAELRGVKLGAVEPGSLAGPDIDWSARQLPDGDIAGHANQPSWIAPPGNGYGFLHKARRGTPAGAWTADWKIDARTRLRVHVPPTPGVQVISALANGLYPHYPAAGYVLARHDAEESEFIAAIEPYSGEPRITAIERIPGGVLIRLRDGSEDHVWSTPGRFVHARLKAGRLLALAMAGATTFQGFGWRVRIPAVHGAVVAAEGSRVTVTPRLPAGLRGAAILFSNPAYSRNTAYRIAAAAARRVELEETPRLGFGRVQTLPDAATITTMVPHEYANSVRRPGGSTFFQGKRIRSESGAVTRIRSVSQGQPVVLKVESSRGFRTGEMFYYEDLQPGDVFDVPAVLSIAETAPNRYRISGNPRPKVSAPAGASLE